VRRRSIALACVTLVWLSAVPAWAGDAGRTELTVFGGASVAQIRRDGAPRFPLVLPAIYALRTRLGAGALLGLRVTRYLGGRAALELDLSVAPSQEAEFRAEVICSPGQPCPRLPDCALPEGCAAPLQVPEFLIQERLTSWQYSLAFTYDLTASAARPYLGAAAGGATFTGLESRDTDLRLGVLAGLKLGSGRLRGRVELADFVATSHFLTGRSEHDVQVRAGLSVRLP
jgi:hypothetical protein